MHVSGSYCASAPVCFYNVAPCQLYVTGDDTVCAATLKHDAPIGPIKLLRIHSYDNTLS